MSIVDNNHFTDDENCFLKKKLKKPIIESVNWSLFIFNSLFAGKERNGPDCRAEIIIIVCSESINHLLQN